MQGKTIIIGFTLQRLIGKGGMAEVWLAENDLHKRVAVKILNADLSLNQIVRDRFRREAEIMAQLEHPNIRSAISHEKIDERPAIVMEYLEGSDLKTLMNKGQQFTQEEMVKWWNQLVDALNYAHQHELKVVHRDIKPSNIFLEKKEGNLEKKEGNVKLLDFGIAKIKEDIHLTTTGRAMGTLMYMSPEQADNAKDVTPASDAYSLAVTFVHLLTGRAPFDSTASDRAILNAIAEQPLDLTGVPAQWQGFLAPYLAKKPEDRPALRHFGAAQPLDNDETTVDVGQKTETPTPKPNPKPKKLLWIALGIAAAAFLLVTLLKPKPDPDTQAYEACQTVADYRAYQRAYGEAGKHYAEAQAFIAQYVADSTAHADSLARVEVDLGLPSGTLWATCNIGASKPEDYGSYFAWGETYTKSTYNWSTYKYANGNGYKLTKYCNDSDYGNNGFTDNLTVLQAGDDPATAKWGSGWRTPSKEQWEELLSNTTHQWTTQNGVKGRKFTSKKNGNSVFLPAAGRRWDSELYDAGSYGYYWSRSLYTDYPIYAWRLYFYSDVCYVDYDYRYHGFSVRPVREK